MYVIDEGGDLLAVCLQRDWEIFSFADSAKSIELMIAITGDDEMRTARYKAKVEGDASQLERWDAFRGELKHENRYFPQLVPDFTDLQILLAMLTMPILDLPMEFFRARNHTGARPFRIEEMGMPNHARATSGRANPRGIPYLYVASDVKTALAEIRPFKGDSVSVSKYKAVDVLKLVDLRNPRNVISPFDKEEETLVLLFKGVPFHDLLGDELSRPVGTKLAELEYLPSQYLCEFIKHIGFEGVVYSSSLGPGYNVALFSEEKVERSQVSEYHIDDIKLSSSKVAL